MMEGLPKGWIVTDLENCTQILDKYRKPISLKERNKRIADKKEEDLYPYYGATSQVGYIDGFLIEGRFVLIGEDGAPFFDSSKNIAYIVDGKIWVNNHAHILDSLTDNNFLCHFLNQFDYTGYVTGTTRLKLTQTRLKQIQCPFPPFNEQKRIAAKLDKIIPRIDAIKERLDKVPTIIKRFRQSVLTAAVTGKLTEKWREEHPEVDKTEMLLDEISVEKYKIPDSWSFVKLNKRIAKIQAGKNFSCPEIPVTCKTVGIVKISAVTWDKFNPKETKTVQDQSNIHPEFFIKKNDFLISRANTIELVGASVIVDEINYRIMISDKVWRVYFYEIDKKFVHYYLKSSKGRNEIEVRSSGSQLSMRNISQKAFRDIDIPLPPFEEQKEIVRQVDNLFTIADNLETHYQNAKAKVDKLTQSVLAKAFRGELVPQDSNDEPAEKLLERIQEEKAKMETAAKKKKKTKKKPAKKKKKAG
ncbi:restriction endonuclease subunit S [Desulfobacterales bacterium HSG16]|nr:restriction endonuclease subunit S [Desulfobacterales bacterium HSG16]